VTEFSRGTASPYSLSPGVAGDLWFSSNAGCPPDPGMADVPPADCVLGRIAMDGRVTRLTGGILANAGIAGITPDPTATSGSRS
jgi:hypothetical protein